MTDKERAFFVKGLEAARKIARRERRWFISQSNKWCDGTRQHAEWRDHARGCWDIEDEIKDRIRRDGKKVKKGKAKRG